MARADWYVQQQKNYIQGPVLGRTFARSSLAGGEHLLSRGSDFLWTLLQHLDRLCVSSGYCSMFTAVVHCTTTEIDCNWQQPRGEGIINPFSVSFNISLHTVYTNKCKITNGTRTILHRGPLRAGPDHVSDTSRGSMPARRRVYPPDDHRFLGETQSSARGRWR